MTIKFDAEGDAADYAKVNLIHQLGLEIQKMLIGGNVTIKTYGVDVHEFSQRVVKRNEIRRKLLKQPALTKDTKARAVHQLSLQIQEVIQNYSFTQAEEERPITRKVVFAAPGETP